MTNFSGKELALRIYGVNRNGKSVPAIIEGFSLKVAELQIGAHLVGNLEIGEE